MKTTEAQLSKSLNIQNPPTDTDAFSLLLPSEMASLSNSRLQNNKERANRSTNNGDMVEKAKRDTKE